MYLKQSIIWFDALSYVPQESNICSIQRVRMVTALCSAGEVRYGSKYIDAYVEILILLQYCYGDVLGTVYVTIHSQRPKNPSRPSQYSFLYKQRPSITADEGTPIRTQVAC